MTAQPQLPNAKSKDLPAGEPQFAPHARLAVVYFDRSVMFGSEMDSASVPSAEDLKRGQRGSNSVDSIELEWLAGNGHGAPSDGIILRRNVHDLNTGKRIVRQTFVPWSNIRSISYGE